ncbi:ferritin-like fold-containing protein [Quadrisphaera sp. DSM 44207]|uniref:ferritin-like fold-containing protein n=1 Tax=Quadrisphaera sp. DSM 44207 TaxID=1881057 RepID=UPI00087FEA0B|nr:ferritin-like fold-containing protein [Quadrisphaera sp. DSM 44207]SDQ71988.1 tRNA-(MS[2]IO[6]A)-hydroxylase (MiaE)-like [Quadrisphaera sp. DSM 44207]
MSAHDAAGGAAGAATPPAPGRALAAEVDLLAALAYGELTGFLHLAQDAAGAPTVPDRAALGALAVAEFEHYRLLRDGLQALGADPTAAMEPFAPAVDSYHERTAPSDWLEGLVKAYVGQGIATDFYREVAALVGAPTRELVHRVLADAGDADPIVDAVRQAIRDEPRVAGRLALWARRLVGEALSQAQRVAADREALSAVLVEGGEGAPGADLVELGRMFNRITEAHVRRMQRLGLTA